MIEVSWTAVSGFVLFVVAVGPGFYWIGRLSKQVDHNTSSIQLIWSKINTIHEFVKNGRT